MNEQLNKSRSGKSDGYGKRIDIENLCRIDYQLMQSVN